MNPFPSQETLSLLHQLLRSHLGQSVELIRVDVMNWRRDYWVLVVDLERPRLRVVVKLSGPEAPYECPYQRVAWFHRLVSEKTSIRMPEIIGVDVSCRDWPWRYLIKTYLAGITWKQVQPRLAGTALREAYFQIGRAVGELHSIRFDAFGNVGPEASGDGDFLPVWKLRLPRYIQDPGLLQRAYSLQQRYGDCFREVGAPTLCHEDLHPYNILFQKTAGGTWELATILDFDKGWAGTAEIDLARLELWRGMTGEGFWEGYQSLRMPGERYEERRPVYQLLWCMEYAENTRAHMADTNRLCRLLGEPEIERFPES